LLQHSHLVYQDVDFNDLVIFDAGIDQPFYIDGLARGRVAQKLSFVRAAHCPVRCDFVTLDNLILDGAMQIGEGHSEHGDPLLETRPVSGHAPTQMMADAVGRDQFIYDREIALVEGFVKDLLDDGLTLNG